MNQKFQKLKNSNCIRKLIFLGFLFLYFVFGVYLGLSEYKHWKRHSEISQFVKSTENLCFCVKESRSCLETDPWGTLIDVHQEKDNYLFISCGRDLRCGVADIRIRYKKEKCNPTFQKNSK